MLAQGLAVADRTEKPPTPARRLPWFIRSVSCFSASLSPCDDALPLPVGGGLPVGRVLRGEGFLLGGENRAGVAGGRDSARLPPFLSTERLCPIPAPDHPGNFCGN